MLKSERHQGRYVAFISYKHAVDSAFAAQLELDIKQYAKGTLSLPRRIFRDEQHINPGEDLSGTIKAALIESEFLILLASKEAATSMWVQQEIDLWCGYLNRTDRLIIILTSGQIGLTKNRNAIDWRSTNALPTNLKKYLKTFPLWVDLSQALTPSSRTLGDPGYKSAVNAVVARMENKSPNELLGKEWQIRRRNIRIAWSVSAILLTLLIISTAMGIYLDRALDVSQSRELAANSRLESAPVSFNSAIRSVEIAQTNESVRSLLDVMSRYRALKGHILKAPSAIEYLVHSPDGESVLYGPLGKGLIGKTNFIGTQITSVVIPTENRIVEIATRNSQLLLATQDSLWKMDWPGGDVVMLKRFVSDSAISTIAAPPGENSIIIGRVDGTLERFDLKTEIRKTLFKHRGMLTQIVTTKDWLVTVATTQKDSVVVTSVSQKISRSLPNVHKTANAIALSNNSKQLAVAFEDGSVGVWLLPSLEFAWEERLEYSASALAFSPDDKSLAAGDSAGRVVIFNQNGDRQDDFQAIVGGVWGLLWTADSELLTGGSDGWLRVWRPIDPGPFAKPLPNADHHQWWGKTLAGVNDAGFWQNESGDISQHEYALGQVQAFTGPVAITKRNERISLLRFGKSGTINEIPFPQPDPELRGNSFKLSESGRWAAIAWWPRDWSKRNSDISLWDLENNTVKWLGNGLRAPKALSFFDDELFAAANSEGSLAIWKDISSVKNAVVPITLDTGPITALAFLDRERLIIGMLQGSAEIRAVDSPKSVLALTERVVGSVREILVLPDRSIVTVDIDAVRWFDEDLVLRGPLLSTEHRQISAFNVAVNPDGTTLAVAMQGGTSIQVPLSLSAWVAEAKARAGTQPRL